MTDYEIEKFAKSQVNKVDTIHEASIKAAKWARDQMIAKRDEYAEEYAKALLKYMGFADIEPDQLVNDFKESLKK